jgi:hypothetical protein
MKKNRLVKLLFTFCLPILLVGCEKEIGEENSPKGTGTDFGTLSSVYEEIDGTGTVTIPVRGGSLSESDISFTGTATQGEDFEFVGVTGECVQISIIDDNDFEPLEFVKVVIESTGNNVHTISIVSNCEDTENPYLGYFQGDWNATEFYCGLGVTTGNCDYGPYEITLVQDSEDPNRFDFDNLYDSGCDAYMIFDPVAGTVYFPDQAPCGIDLTNSSGTFVIDECNNASTLTINLNFDGGDWIYYFEKL